MVDAVWLALGFVGVHKQWNGQAKPKCEHFIDDIIPDGI